MKNTFLAILSIFTFNVSSGQIITRHPAESTDSLVLKTIGKNSIKVGNVYEFQDSNSNFIIYFEIKSADSSMGPPEQDDLVNHGFPYFTSGPTLTLFNMLVSTDRINYTKYVIDTLDQGWAGGCHLPVHVDSALFLNDGSNDGLVLFLMHPVKATCSSMTRYSMLFYNHFETHIKAGKFSLKPIESFGYSHSLYRKSLVTEWLNEVKPKK